LLLKVALQVEGSGVLALIFRLSNFVKYCINLQTLQASPTKSNPNQKGKKIPPKKTQITTRAHF